MQLRGENVNEKNYAIKKENVSLTQMTYFIS